MYGSYSGSPSPRETLAHDPDIDGDRAVAFEHGRQHGDSLLCESVGSVATAAAHSAALSCIMKSAGKRLRLRLTACSRTLSATPYKAASSNIKAARTGRAGRGWHGLSKCSRHCGSRLLGALDLRRRMAGHEKCIGLFTANSSHATY